MRGDAARCYADRYEAANPEADDANGKALCAAARRGAAPIAMKPRTGIVAVIMLAAGASACAGARTGSPGPLAHPTATAAGVATTALEAPSGTATGDYFRSARESLVASGIVGMGIRDAAVIDAMGRVRRELFVPERYRDQAYANHPLPIGHGQTISQPYIVALMTEALELERDDLVLEIGTGSGYQAAILSELVDRVYSIEIVGALVETALANLDAAGCHNVDVRHGDGYFGWEEHAPYDAIIVTAAPDHIPPPLKAQLAVGGRMIVPVGPVGGYQELWRVQRHGGGFATDSLGGVVFVPLTRGER